MEGFICSFSAQFMKFQKCLSILGLFRDDEDSREILGFVHISVRAAFCFFGQIDPESNYIGTIVADDLFPNVGSHPPDCNLLVILNHSYEINRVFTRIFIAPSQYAMF